MLKLWIPAIGLFHLASIYVRGGKTRQAIIAIAFAVIWFFIFGPIINFVKYLGVDSFSEARNFDVVEAYFWLTTVLDTVSVRWSTVCLGSAVSFIYIGFWYWVWKASKERSKWVSKTRQAFECVFIFAFVIVFPALVINRSINRFWESSDLYETVKANFTHTHERMNIKNLSKGVSVFLYIGESTSPLNMGLYGYPRATTPLLLDFKNNHTSFMSKTMWSTHAHTSPSLLEALSIAAQDESVMKPLSIFKRKRVSLTNILNEAGIKTHLFSNQGATGTFNLASSIIFSAAEREFSSDMAFAYGNRADRLDDKPFDHEVLQDMIHKRLGKIEIGESAFYVFHSYSGHGPYKKFVPREYQEKVDNYYADVSNESIFGDLSLNISRVEAYDSTISYIDSNIAQALEYVKKQSAPMVFVYMSDHGEAVLAGRGHDSARFVSEMLRVPLMVYFNDAAMKAIPDTFKATKDRLETHQFSNLGQFSDMILEIFGVEVNNRPDGRPYLACPVGAKACAPSTLMVRDFDSKTGFVRTQAVQNFGEDFVDLTDAPTEHNILHRHFKDKGIGICYEKTNSLAKAFRGVLSTDCLEVDITIDQSGTAIVYSKDGSSNTNVSSNDLPVSKLISAVSGSQRIKFFMNAKFETAQGCHLLQEHLLQNVRQTVEVLVNFPSSVSESIEDFEDCFKALRTDSAILSYEVPTELGIQCAHSLKNGMEFSEASNCVQLNAELDQIASTHQFTDISFKNEVYGAIRKSSAAQGFRWNVQHIEASESLNLPTEHVRLIVPQNADVNTRY